MGDAGDSKQQPVEEEIPLTLKVMRLCQPNLSTAKLPLTVSGEPLYDALMTDLSAGSGIKMSGSKGGISGTEVISEGDSPFGITSSLVLPQAFGNIYNGEKFSCYLSLSNHTRREVHTRGLKAEITTKQQTHLLLEDAGKMGVIGSGESKDSVISFQLRSPGMHMLLITAQYVGQSGQQRAFRKYFKFQVLSPLQVTSKAVSMGDGADATVLVESSIQNITQTPIVLEAVIFNPGYDTKQCEAVGNSDEKDPASAAESFLDLEPGRDRYMSSFLSPSDVVHRTFRMSPPPGPTQGDTLGRLEIFWRNSDGLSGHIECAPLRSVGVARGGGRRSRGGSGSWDGGRSSSLTPPISMAAVGLPPIAYQGKIFPCTLEVRNDGPRPAALTLEFSVQDGTSSNGGDCCVVPVAVSGTKFEPLAPGARLRHTLDFLPLKTGLCQIMSLRLVDGEVVYNCDDLGSVYVQPPDDDPELMSSGGQQQGSWDLGTAVPASSLEHGVDAAQANNEADGGRGEQQGGGADPRTDGDSSGADQRGTVAAASVDIVATAAAADAGYDAADGLPDLLAEIATLDSSDDKQRG